jgi:hypothetical protein
MPAGDVMVGQECALQCSDLISGLCHIVNTAVIWRVFRRLVPAGDTTMISPTKFVTVTNISLYSGDACGNRVRNYQARAQSPLHKRAREATDSLVSV